MRTALFLALIAIAGLPMGAYIVSAQTAHDHQMSDGSTMSSNDMQGMSRGRMGGMHMVMDSDDMQGMHRMMGQHMKQLSPEERKEMHAECGKMMEDIN